MGIRSLLCACALVLAALPRPSSALSYVMMRDDALVEAAPVIVLAEAVDEIPGAVDAGGFVVDTRYVVDVAREIKGHVASQALILRVPGAHPSVSGGLFVPGMPRLEPGRPVLLFLQPRADGTYAPADLALGVFHEIELDGERVYARDLNDAHSVGKDANAQYGGPRDAARFVEWVADYARGWRRPPDYFIGEGADGRAKFTQIRAVSDNNPVRWFKFDTSQSETWFALQDGQNNTVSDEFQGFQNAIAAWNNDAGSNVRYAYGGTTASDPGNNSNDGKSAIVWNDPGDAIPLSYRCGIGGTLAIGGSFFTGSTTNFGGVPYHTTVEGFIIVQDGAGCAFDGNGGEDGEETMAHELGHTLGLAHSCGDSQTPCSGVVNAALMRPRLHADGRGALLGTDDIAGINLIYPAGGGGGPPDPIFAHGFE